MTEGNSSTLARIATFTDSDNAFLFTSYTATITWDTGQTSVGLVSGLLGSFSLYGYHSYPEEGTKSVSFTINDVDGDTLTGSSTATIADAALTASGGTTSIVGNATIPLSFPVGTFTDADPGGVASDYTATINWGDSSSGAGTVTAVPSTGTPAFAVAGSHAYAAGGNYNVSVTVTDSGGSSVVLTGTTATIAAAPAAGSMTSATGGTIINWPAEGLLQAQITLATLTDPDSATDAAGYTATINWGDGSSGAGTVSGGAGRPITVSGAHAYAEEGADGITVSVTDITDSATLVISDTAIVPDAALSVSGGAQIRPNAQTLYSGPVGSFLDADPGGTSTDYKANIDWGDGFQSAGTVTAMQGISVQGTHKYLKQGSYPVVVTVTDAPGNSAVLNETAVVGPPPPPPNVMANGFI